MNKTTGGELAAVLKAETGALHSLTERSGAMADLLRGRLSLHDYCVMLRNLQPIYAVLEAGLDEHAEDARLWRPELRRLHALEQDLDQLHAGDWRSELIVAPTAGLYVTRLTALIHKEPLLLLAHAYVRYLGDLSGGQMLSGLIRRQYGRDCHTGTAFYAFGEPSHVDALKRDFRDGLDALTLMPTQRAAFVEEAREAFRLHQRLFEELRA